MASFLRLRQLPLLQKCLWNHHSRISRNIATSKKSGSAAAACTESKESEEDKNWVSYGFDYNSKTEDTNAHHATFLFSVTLCLVFGGFAWSYAPDTFGRDWAQREAFLELRRREKAGLPPIDPNYVDPKTVVLPPDHELCEFEIII